MVSIGDRALVRGPQRRVLVMGASLIALTPGGAAFAQTAAPDPAAVDEVVVTGSRIATQVGFTTPTPVTVVTAEQMKVSSPLVVEGLKDLPTLTIGGTRANGTGGGGGGQATINLRALGSSRVLVLLDGRRVAPERANGEVNTALMPNPLIAHVDVVTGGASAAYGSDAVAGVVNFVLDKTFTGVRGNVYAGISDRNDREEFGGEIGVGLPFAGGRGHFLTSLDYTNQNGFRWDDRPYGPEGLFLFTNPVAGQTPRLIRGDNGKFDTGSDWGLVTTGPLAGLMFEPDGSFRQFNYGTLRSGGRHRGGDGAGIGVGPGAIIVGWQNRGGMFNRLSFDLNDKVTVFAENQVYWTKNISSVGWGYSTGATGFVIRNDNAFLNPTLRARMATLNVTSFRLDRFNADFPVEDLYVKTFKWRPVIGVDFKFNNFNGEEWNGEASFSPSYSKRRLVYQPGMDQIRSIQAADAVIAPVGNTAGVMPGTIVCRATLTNTLFQGRPCVPLNVMGTGSPAAIADLHPYDAEWNQDIFKQQSFSASINGPLFNLPAGTLSAAVGIDYRHETIDVTSDPYSQTLNPITNALGGWRAGSAQPYSGTQAVKEAFVELQVPLLRDLAFVENLDLNAAARVTDYRTSGTVATWKVGVMYRPIEGLLIRGTRSHDIRAPSLSELYNKGTVGTATVRDPFRNNTSYGGVKTATTGNPDLVPEIGDTTVIGFTYQPPWFNGLSAAVDLWDIRMEKAIGSIANQQIIDDCFLDQTSYECDFIVRDATGLINSINNQPINFSKRRVQGIDYELSYRTNLEMFGGSAFNVRLVATQLRKSYTDSRGIIDSSLNEIGNPKWRALLQTTLRSGPVTTTLSGRYVGESIYDARYVSGVDIDDNTVSDYATLDARLAYRLPVLNDGVEVYVSVANVFDRKPVKVFHDSGTVPTGTDSSTYDIIGRYFRTGLTFKF